MAGSAADETAHEILQVIPLVMRVLAAELRQSGCLEPAHLRALTMLGHRTCTLSELADAQAVSLPTASNSITALEDRGWVRRTRSDQDRRVVRVELTAQGRQAVEDAHRQAEARLRALLDSLSPGEMETLRAGLALLRQMFGAGRQATRTEPARTGHE